MRRFWRVIIFQTAETFLRLIAHIPVGKRDKRIFRDTVFVTVDDAEASADVAQSASNQLFQLLETEV